MLHRTLIISNSSYGFLSATTRHKPAMTLRGVSEGDVKVITSISIIADQNPPATGRLFSPSCLMTQSLHIRFR
jgi:hypothetical protein